MVRYIFRSLIIIVLVFIFSSIQGQEDGSVDNSGLPFQRSYTRLDHGSGENYRSIIQDHRGIIYIGNDQGILEFDGTDWNLIPNADGSLVRSLCIDQIYEHSTEERPFNRIYVGSSGDIGYLGADSKGTLIYHSLLHLIPEEDRNFGVVHRVVAVNEGIAFQTGNYLFLYQNGEISVIRPPDSGFHFVHSLNGRLYVTQNESGPWRLKDKKLELVENPLITPGMYIMDMFPLSGSSALVLTYEDGFYLFDEFGFHPWSVAANDVLKNFKCYTAAQSSNGDLIVQTMNNGMFLLNESGDILATFNEANGRGEFVSYDLMFDQIGNLWTVHSSVINFLELSSPFSQYDNYAGLAGRGESSDLFNGNLYVSTANGLFAKPWDHVHKQLDQDRIFQPVDVPKNLSINLAVIGNSLFVSFVDGLMIINPEKNQEFPEEQVGRIYEIIRLKQDSSWVLCTSSIGLMLFENTEPYNETPNWKLRKKFEEIQGDHLFLEEGPASTFWVTKPLQGFWKFGLDLSSPKLVDPHIYGTESGLPISGVNKVFKLDSEAVFTTLEGMFRYSDSKDRFLPDTAFNRSLKGRVSIFDLCEDQNGNIWVWSENPIRRDFESGKRLQLLQPQNNINGKNGYQNIDRLFQRVRKNLSDRIEISPMENNSVLFSSDNGLIQYDPNIRFDILTPFSALIRKVQITTPSDNTIFGGSQADEFGVPDTISDIVHQSNLRYENNGVRFTCSAIYPINPDDLQFKFFMKGNDQSWSEWTNESSKEYSNLKEGTYTFHVKARNIFQTESRVAKYTLTITPPWHRSWLAYTGYALAGIGLIWLIVKINTRRLRKDKERLEATVEKRTVELRKTNEKLVEMDQFKQGMTSMIVHDLKNPLNAILNAPKSLTVENQIQVMKNSGRQMLNMVMNMLDLDKYEESRMTPDLVEVSLSELIGNAIRSVEFLSQQKNISLINNLSSGHSVLGDQEILERVMTNLLTNAIKFTPVSGRIQISSEKYEGEMVKVMVEDTGEGIPKDKLDKVFKKFGQVMAKRSGGVRSTGLGLTFCKMAIEAHGGAIGVDSKIGEGSTFWFTLDHAKRISEAGSNPIEEQRQEDEIQFSQEEIDKFKEIAIKLKTIPVYKITQIRDILRDQNDHLSGKLFEEMLKAVNTGDQKKYEALIYQILHEGE